MRFPFLQSDGLLSAFAVPQRSRVLIDSTAGYSDPDPTAPSTILGGQRLSVPVTGITGIGIAADSAIPSCDISLSGAEDDANRYRISPGNPALGLSMDDHSYITVSLPQSMPQLPVTPQTYLWDGYLVNSPSGLCWGIPLRLELYYNGMSPQRVTRRAPIHGSARLVNQTAVSAVGMYVYVEGRRHIQFVAKCSSATCTLQVFAVDLVSTTATPRVDTSSITTGSPIISGALSAGVPLVFNMVNAANEQDINPFRLVIAQITDTAGGSTTFLEIYAWD